MLATDYSNLYLFNTLEDRLRYRPKGIVHKDYLNTPQHLYITSNDEIKEGDYFIKLDGTIVKCKDLSFAFVEDFLVSHEGKQSKKIIATTDKSLKLSEPSEHFIKKYVEEYNKNNIITEVLVDYEKEHIGTIDYSSIEELPKVNLANQITISKVKDSWTREEVVYLIKNDLMNDIDMIYNGQSINQEELDNWIEENL